MPALPETIETDRLVLRSPDFADVDDVMRYAVKEDWSRYMPVPFPYERRDAEEWIAKQTLRDRQVHGGWAIARDGQVIGGIDLILSPADFGASLGYALSPQEWNQGLTTEAVGAVINAGFETIPELARIWAWADSRNAASLRVMEKVGMTREGCLRRHKGIRGELVDAVFCGILRDEWEASR